MGCSGSTAAETPEQYEIRRARESAGDQRIFTDISDIHFTVISDIPELAGRYRQGANLAATTRADVKSLGSSDNGIALYRGKPRYFKLNDDGSSWMQPATEVYWCLNKYWVICHPADHHESSWYAYNTTTQLSSTTRLSVPPADGWRSFEGRLKGSLRVERKGPSEELMQNNVVCAVGTL